MINSKLQPIKWHKTWWGIALIAVLSIIILAMLTFGFYVFYLINKIKTENISREIPKMLQPGKYQMENSASPQKGSSSPVVTIVEFADFNCSHCRKSYPTLKEIVAKYQNEVKIIFRHYPLIEESSINLALAGECAHEQNLFWEMHDRLYQVEAPSEELELIVKQIGLDRDKFNLCFNQQKYLNKIRMDILAAQEADIGGTPAWFINGHKVEGEIPRDVFLQLIEILIKNAK